MFIVFSPTGLTPPVKIHETHQEALSVAHKMALMYPGQKFCVMKQSGKMHEAKPTPVHQGAGEPNKLPGGGE